MTTTLTNQGMRLQSTVALGLQGAVKPCTDFHRYYVPATVGVEKEGKVVVIALCTACGHSFSKEFLVSSGNSPLVIEEKGS